VTMLEITPFMDSSCEDVLAFKTCCGLKSIDQNLEIHIRNRGDESVIVLSRMEIETEAETVKVENLMPHGRHRLEPGQLMAFYCTMEPVLWAKAKSISFFDDKGNRYGVAIEAPSKPCQ
jgi:hypothetical protein